MARPTKEGLDYFPLDVDFFSDIKVRRIKKNCGPASISVLICLLCNIYRDGYYIWWNEDMTFAIAETTGVAEGAVVEIVNMAAHVGFFSKALLDKYGIITSSGIQKRFEYVVKSKKLKQSGIRPEYNLIVNPELTGINSELTGINSELTGVNPEESAQKESKGKEKKRKEKRERDAPAREGELFGAAAPSLPDSLSNTFPDFSQPANASASKPDIDERREKYGEYGWVRLSKREIERLVNEYGQDITSHYITVVDELAQQTGNKNRWKDWNLTVRKAIRDKWGSTYQGRSALKNTNGEKYGDDERFFEGEQYGFNL